MIEVCEVGPPPAVHRPSANLGSSRAVSDGVRSSATRMTGWSGSCGSSSIVSARSLRTRRPTSRRSAARAASTASFIDARMPARSSYMCCQAQPALRPSRIERARRIQHLRIVQKFGVRLEDAGLGRARLLPDLVEQVLQLALRALDRPIEFLQLGDGVARGRLDDDLRPHELADRADGEARRGGDAGGGPRLVADGLAGIDHRRRRVGSRLRFILQAVFDGRPSASPAPSRRRGPRP